MEIDSNALCDFCEQQCSHVATSEWQDFATICGNCAREALATLGEET